MKKTLLGLASIAMIAVLVTSCVEQVDEKKTKQSMDKKSSIEVNISTPKDSIGYMVVTKTTIWDANQVYSTKSDTIRGIKEESNGLKKDIYVTLD